jgi:hypothetical protein
MGQYGYPMKGQVTWHGTSRAGTGSAGTGWVGLIRRDGSGGDGLDGYRTVRDGSVWYRLGGDG